MAHRRVVVTADAVELAELVADKFLVRAKKCIRRQGSFRVVLAGGGIAQQVLEAIARHPSVAELDWRLVDVWWGDERFVDYDSAERNDLPAIAILSTLGVPAENIHRVPSPADAADVSEAASRYATQLQAVALPGEVWPEFDLGFAGMGPDAHVLSIFPGSPHALITAPDVVAVDHSPKPPAQRVSMTIGLLARAHRVWIVVSGPEKAAGLGLALANASPREVPASAVRGSESTKIFTDSALAELLPPELIAREAFWSADDERADYVPKALR